jgi:hypothetical protein
MKTICTDWDGKINSDGYGELRGVGHILAHRKAWELAAGQPVPKGKVLHHSCENRRCVNVEHLELTTQEAHATHHRGGIFRPGFCGMGHKRDSSNLRVGPDGYRRCRSCERLSARKGYYRNRETILRRKREQYAGLLREEGR